DARAAARVRCVVSMLAQRARGPRMTAGASSVRECARPKLCVLGAAVQLVTGQAADLAGALALLEAGRSAQAIPFAPTHPDAAIRIERAVEVAADELDGVLPVPFVVEHVARCAQVITGPVAVDETGLPPALRSARHEVGVALAAQLRGALRS